MIFEKSEVMKSDGTPYTIFTPYSKLWKKKLAEEKIILFHSNKLIYNLFKTKPFHFPSLTEVGFEKSDYEIPSVEINKNIIRNYHLDRNFPSIKWNKQVEHSLAFWNSQYQRTHCYGS